MRAILARPDETGRSGYSPDVAPAPVSIPAQRLDPLVEALGRAVDRLGVARPGRTQHDAAC